MLFAKYLFLKKPINLTRFCSLALSKRQIVYCVSRMNNYKNYRSNKLDT